MESTATIPFKEENPLRCHDPSTEIPMLVIVSLRPNSLALAAAFMLFSATALAASCSVADVVNIFNCHSLWQIQDTKFF